MTTNTTPPAGRSKGKMIGIGAAVLLLGCCGLFAISSMMGGGDTPAPATTADKPAADSPAADVATEAPAAEEPTDEPPTVAALPKVGDVIDIGDGATLTVESAAPNADGELVVVILVDNSAGAEKLTVSSIASFDAKDADGNKGQMAMLLGADTAQIDGEVLPGDKLRGHVAYKGLGAGAKLYYKTSMFGGETFVIDLGQ